MAAVAEPTDLEDPLLLFSHVPIVACMGVWTTNKLNLRIWSQDGRWTLTSGKRDLVLKETERDFEWSVYETIAMEKELYVASVSGCGPRTRLTMRPGRQHAGSGKKLVLWREGYKAEDWEADEMDEAATGSSERRVEPMADVVARRRDDSPGLIGDACDESPKRGAGDSDGGKGNDGRRRGGSEEPRKRHGGGARRQQGRKGNGRGNGRGDANDRDYSADSRDRSRSRSARPAGRSSPRRGGGGKRSGKAEAAADEEVTTIIVRGLPDDSREEEIREDLDVIGAIAKVVLMRRGSDRNAFVRFEGVREATRAMEKINDGKIKVCGSSRAKAEIARRNTN